VLIDVYTYVYAYACNRIERRGGRRRARNVQRQEELADAGHLRRVKGPCSELYYIRLCICMLYAIIGRRREKRRARDVERKKSFAMIGA